MELIWYLVQLLIGYNLVLPFILLVLFFLVKKKRVVEAARHPEPDYAIIVTAYQEITHITETVNSILNLNYQNYICYVVLDNCDDISSLRFDDERVVLLQPSSVLAGNVRSHFFAINNFRRQHRYLTIVDSDNIVTPDYLTALNSYFHKGYRAVQGVRAAKNLNTPLAALDAARDIYYHFYDGLVLFSLGSSATLAGSGMAFEVDLYMECLGNKNVSGAGFDKVLQYEIVRRNERIAFAEEAIVYDQKTSKPEQLVNQRARWINTWFKYFSYGFKLVGSGISNLSINQILLGLILLRPPLFIFLLLSVLFTLANIFIAPWAILSWMVAFSLFILGFLIPLWYYKADPRIIRSLIRIPAFIYYQVISLLHSRKANKRSVATKHFD